MGKITCGACHYHIIMKNHPQRQSSLCEAPWRPSLLSMFVKHRPQRRSSLCEAPWRPSLSSLFVVKRRPQRQSLLYEAPWRPNLSSLFVKRRLQNKDKATLLCHHFLPYLCSASSSLFLFFPFCPSSSSSTAHVASAPSCSFPCPFYACLKGVADKPSYSLLLYLQSFFSIGHGCPSKSPHLFFVLFLPEKDKLKTRTL